MGILPSAPALEKRYIQNVATVQSFPPTGKSFYGKIYSLKDTTEVIVVRGAATTGRRRNRSILLSQAVFPSLADGENKKQKSCSQLKLMKFCNPHGKLRNTGMKCRTASCFHLCFNTLVTCSSATRG